MTDLRVPSTELRGLLVIETAGLCWAQWGGGRLNFLELAAPERHCVACIAVLQADANLFFIGFPTLCGSLKKKLSPVFSWVGRLSLHGGLELLRSVDEAAVHGKTALREGMGEVQD